MASQNRHDRQLMRQRGAGTRNVANADFGLSLSLGGSRQDRQRMRQRGAGRTVEKVDFGFSFRTPSLSRRSNSRASDSSILSARATSRKSGRRSREPSAPRSLRSTSAASNGNSAQEAVADGAEQTDSQQLQPAKRRKLLPNDNGTAPSAGAAPSQNGHTARRKAASMFSIAEEPEQDAVIGEGSEQHVDEEASPSHSPLSLADDDHEKENAAPSEGKSGPKRRKRKSIGQQSTRKKKTSLGGSSTKAQPALQPQNFTAPPVQESPIEEAESVLEQSLDQITDGDRKVAKQAIQPPSLPPKRRKKRKSVILVKKKRRSSGGTKPPTKRANSSGEVESNHDQEEDFEAPPVPFVRKHGRQPSPVMQSIEVDEVSDEEYVDEEESPEPPTPGPPKKALKATKVGMRTHRSSERRTPQASAGRRKASFPVLTHRMTNLDALPTIEEEGKGRDSNDGEDAGAASHSLGRGAAPNAVDVLAQICREMIETAVERVGTDASGESQAGRQRKRNALEAFGADLDSRLFEMSAAVEDRINLEARARKVKREKADLQARWIEVRTQRERVALKCDRVRREHWESEQAREERWKISEAAQKAELELERNGPDGEEGLEFLLHSVAGEVTDSHEGGGLLNRMKSLNQQLEKMAGMLEGRVG